MSVRSFRDRYGALGQPDGQDPGATVVDDAWPLPDGGALVETGYGYTVATIATLDGQELSIARRLLQDAGITGDVDSTLFLDTETTGLSGGTGTHVFLVGVGRFEGDRFTVRQYFMRHPGEERAMLDAIERDVRDSSCLITYNGRTFDVPLLETRYRMHHHRFPSPEQHLDLLHPVRAVWKHRLPSCSLGTVEEHILGVQRVDDAPGWMIPQMYFSYLQSRRVETLRSVFSHNLLDIVSLARLAGLVHGFQAGIESPAHPTDRLGVALIHLRQGNVERALPVVRELGSSALVPAELRFRALRELSVEMKRTGKRQDVLELWERGLSDSSRAIRLYSSEELAKHMEHHSRDHQAALDLARRAADGARLAGDHRTAAQFDRRTVRLEEKMRRASQPGTMERT